MAESTEKKTVAERAADLSEDVLESVRDRQQTVIEAMRKFVDRLDEALPDLGEERRKKVLDALVDFAEKLSTTTNDFAARMVRSASGTLKARRGCRGDREGVRRTGSCGPPRGASPVPFVVHATDGVRTRLKACRGNHADRGLIHS
jgi:hypothetical protein